MHNINEKKSWFIKSGIWITAPNFTEAFCTCTKVRKFDIFDSGTWVFLINEAPRAKAVYEMHLKCIISIIPQITITL